MNKSQKFFLLLWIMLTIVEFAMFRVVADPDYRWQYSACYAFLSLFLLGMIWVMADKKH